MKFRLSIGRKIGIGFGLLIFLTLINFIFTFQTVNEGKELNLKITTVYSPSVEALEQLSSLLIRSSKYIQSWVIFNVEPANSPFKEPIRLILESEYPLVKKELKSLSEGWNDEQEAKLDSVLQLVDELFQEYRQVMSDLATFEDHEDFFVKELVRENVFATIIPAKLKEINKILDELMAHERSNSHAASQEMISSFALLQGVVQNSGVLLVIGGILIAFFTIRTIVRPIYELKGVLQLLGKGIFPKENIIKGDDEIGEMSVALDYLVEGLRKTTDFSREIGSGNFESDFKPLSDQDVLGHALLKMRSELKESEAILEAKVIERTEEVVRQSKEIQLQKDEIEEKSKKLQELYENVTDSIKYAKRIQQSILPPIPLTRQVLPESFILYKPKDIVSGDFYWMDISPKKDVIYIAAVDCTGHGVPGAFMSIVGYNSLNQIMVETKYAGSSSIVLDRLNQLVSQSLRQTHDGDMSKDGMDIAMCKINRKNKTLEYAGAYNPLIYISEGEVNEIKPDKFPIGIFIDDEKKSFTNHVIKTKPGDVFYIFSDGYADQFGGPRGKKFMYRQFRELLFSIHQEPMDKQLHILDEAIEKWKGSIDQLDDILVIGFRI